MLRSDKCVDTSKVKVVNNTRSCYIYVINPTMLCVCTLRSTCITVLCRTLNHIHTTYGQLQTLHAPCQYMLPVNAALHRCVNLTISMLQQSIHTGRASRHTYLHKAALYLPDVDSGVETPAHVHDDVRPQHLYTAQGGCGGKRGVV